MSITTVLMVQSSLSCEEERNKLGSVMVNRLTDFWRTVWPLFSIVHHHVTTPVRFTNQANAWTPSVAQPRSQQGPPRQCLIAFNRRQLSITVLKSQNCRTTLLSSCSYQRHKPIQNIKHEASTSIILSQIIRSGTDFNQGL